MDARQITVTLPAELVDEATRSHGKGVEETLTDALREQMHREASAALMALRGKVEFESTWQELAGKYDEEKNYW